LRAKALYQSREYGLSKQVLRRVSQREAVSPVLAEEIALYERRIESALVRVMPPSARQAIRTSETIAELDLSGRDLAALPDSIGQLTGLRLLDLPNNRLSGVPETLGGLTSLQDQSRGQRPL
jgi:Leucine-rich repeat (LRR) protein